MPKNDFKGTPHFSLRTDPKLTCSCGCRLVPDQDFMEKVEKLRVELGFSLTVTSGARCPAYNQQVSSTGPNGPHTTGRAIDFGTRGEEALEITEKARAAGFTGIGVNQKGNGRFIHIDDLPNAPNQPRPHIWSY